MIKHILLACAFVLLCGASQQTHAGQSLTIGDSYNRACITNYIRVVPHFCGNTTTPQTPVALTLDNTCRSFNPGAIPSTVNNVSVNTAWTITSTNAVGKKGMTFTNYQESSCTLVNKTMEYSVDEMAARAADTTLQIMSVEMSMAVFSGLVYYKGVINAGGASTGMKENVVGYFD